MGVMTVLGEIPADAMGFTQTHEHVLANCDLDGNDWNMVMDDVDVAAEELEHFRRAGGRTMLDLTCDGIGRDVRGLQEAARRTGVNIVASTGWYRECFHPAYVARESADQLARRMIRDIREGMDGTEVRAGIIAELATEYGVGKMSPAEVKVFTAAAYAQRETGLPVSTHCWAGELAFPQIDVLTRNGVPPEKIVIGHLAVDPAVKEHVFKVADTGVRLGIDCVGYSHVKWVIMTDPERARFVKELIDRGHLRQLTVSQDAARKLLLKRYHGPGYDCIPLQFVPLLQAAGVSGEQIHAIFVENPRALFS
jgi:predicted metal-dependent phosphotriesterase family hydrolase